MTNEYKRQRYETKLAANAAEIERQMVFVGLRLGVFATLKRLDKERERIMRKIAELSADTVSD